MHRNKGEQDCRLTRVELFASLVPGCSAETPGGNIWRAALAMITLRSTDKDCDSIVAVKHKKAADCKVISAWVVSSHLLVAS